MSSPAVEQAPIGPVDLAAEREAVGPALEEAVLDCLRSGEPARAWRGFERAKAACAACHQAEDVDYMNNQPVFDLAAPQDEAQ